MAFVSATLWRFNTRKIKKIMKLSMVRIWWQGWRSDASWERPNTAWLHSRVMFLLFSSACSKEISCSQWRDTPFFSFYCTCNCMRSVYSANEKINKKKQATHHWPSKPLALSSNCSSIHHTSYLRIPKYSQRARDEEMLQKEEGEEVAEEEEEVREENGRK